jgi:anthranilate phosphoribosyltransferase
MGAALALEVTGRASEPRAAAALAAAAIDSGAAANVVRSLAAFSRDRA